MLGSHHIYFQQLTAVHRKDHTPLIFVMLFHDRNALVETSDMFPHLSSHCSKRESLRVTIKKCILNGIQAPGFKKFLQSVLTSFLHSTLRFFPKRFVSAI